MATTSTASQPLRYQVIKSLDDFPAPVSGVITLEDNTTYLINGTVDVGTNRFVVGIKNTITGLDRQNDVLISSTTGTMFTMDNSVTPKLTLIFDNLTLRATAGTLIDASGGTTDQVTFITVTISQTVTGGSFSGVSFSMRTSSLSSAFSSGGFTFTGTNGGLTFRDSTSMNNTGTVFNTSSSTFTVIRISRNFIDVSAGQTFLNATSTTISNAATFALNISSGAGTLLTGVTAETSGWLFIGNQGTANSSNASLPAISGNATKYLRVNAGGTATEWSTVSGSGDVVGPASSTDNAVARFDSTTGKLLQNSGVTIDDSGNLTATNISGTNTGDQTLPVKATGAEVDTGTDDAKFVTAKAMEDSSYIKAAYADGKVADAINDGTTTVAPSQNAVFDALALKGRANVYNASTAAQGAGFSTDTYLTGSSCAIPASSLQAKTMYRCVFNVTKTAAGTATPIINIRFGTNGSTADTSRGTLTFTAGTAAADEGVVEIWATFRTVGSGTSAVLQTVGRFTHRLSVTGLTGTNAVSEPEIATSGGFDSTVSNSIIGISVNGGASASWTVSLVQAELVNLV